MEAFSLRGRKIEIQNAPVFEDSTWDAPPVGIIYDQIITIYGVVYARRHRSSQQQEPYAYIDESLDSARGLWLENTATFFSVLEEPDTP